MEPYKHRRSRAFHEFRYGLGHFRKHRTGVKHHHRKKRRRTTPAVPPAAAAVRRRRRRILLGSLTVVVLLVVLVCALAYKALVETRNELDTAELTAASVSHNPSVLTSPQGRSDLAATIRSMNLQATAASNTINGSTALKILGVLPVVGTQVDGARSLVTDLHVAAGQAGTLLTSLQTLTAHSSATSINLADLSSLSTKMDAASTIFASLHRSPSGLWGPIHSARTKFNHDVVRITGLVSQGSEALRYALPLLGANGPRTYFLAAENNAEMRDQGAVLSWALIHTHDGSYDVDSPASVDTLPLYSPAPIPIPPGTEEVFGPLQPTMVWQSVNATADFPWSGAAMASMYTKASHGQQVNGVIALDVVGLRDLLGLTGPVQVPGVRQFVSQSNIESLVLSKLYRQYPNGDAQADRKDVLSTIAKAVVDNLKHDHVDVAALVKTLATAVQGRHLLVWDSDPANEAIVTRFNASGSISAVDPDATFHLAVESAVAAKLDYYIHTQARYAVKITSRGQAFILTTVSITNRAPRNAKPSYALGPDHVNSFLPGQYVSRIYLWSPRGSVVAGGIDESGLVVDPTSLTVNAGQSASLTFQTIIPHAVRKGAFTMHFIPQSTLYPQATSVTISAPGWAVSGTIAKSFALKRPTSLLVHLSR